MYQGNFNGYRRNYRRKYGRRSNGGYRKKKTYRKYNSMTPGKVLRLIDAELKLRDLGVGLNAMPNTTGQISQITAIGQGDSSLQRTGNWIKPITLHGTITVFGNVSAAAGISPIYRVGIACWMQDETINSFALAQIMQDITSPHQGFRVTNKGQFKVLWSRVGVLSSQEDNPNFQKQHRFYVKPPLKVLYDGAGDKNNHLFLFAYSDIAAAANPPNIQFDLRLRFTDS